MITYASDFLFGVSVHLIYIVNTDVVAAVIVGIKLALKASL